MRSLILTLSVVLVFLFAWPVLAVDEGLPDPGITPDSPFYFIETIGERISLFFTFGTEAKAEKKLDHAEKRLAEAKAMADEGREDLAERSLDAYGKLVSEAAEMLAEAAKDGDKDEALAELIRRATGIHQMVLTEVYEKVPEQAKESVQQAMDKSGQGAQKAVENIGGDKQKIREEASERRQEVEQKVESLRERGLSTPDIPDFNGPPARPGLPTSPPAPVGR